MTDEETFHINPRSRDCPPDVFFSRNPGCSRTLDDTSTPVQQPPKIRPALARTRPPPAPHESHDDAAAARWSVALALALFPAAASLPPPLRGLQFPGQSPGRLSATNHLSSISSSTTPAWRLIEALLFFPLTPSCYSQARQYSTEKGGDNTGPSKPKGGGSSAPRHLRPGDTFMSFIALRGHCIGYRGPYSSAALCKS
jgi:hypothetical protein